MLYVCALIMFLVDVKKELRGERIYFDFRIVELSSMWLGGGWEVRRQGASRRQGGFQERFAGIGQAVEGGAGASLPFPFLNLIPPPSPGRCHPFGTGLLLS